jgi:crossover junction endodeoxyribonuclease RuvC
MRILGIDPGLSGGLAILDPDGTLAVHDMPVFEIVRNGKKKREVDAALLADTLDGVIKDAFGLRIDVMAFVEQVWGRPGEAAANSFNFGQSFGVVLGALAALQIPITRVPPATWTKALGVQKGDDAGRRRASELMPQHAHIWARKKDDGRADSVLIALFGQRSQQRAAA